ncbi:MAG: TfoX/Sxy family protein [Hyphomicrobiales bacterium]|nr:TfoX/Sxy family protein [Hyphomicrobiales bacterium]
MKDLFAPCGEVRLRRMFSGHGVYLGEYCIALAIKAGLCLRVDAESRAAFEALGARPFSYAKTSGTVTVQAWWQVPDTLLDDPDALAPWARLSFETARRLPPKRRRAAPRKPAAGAQRGLLAGEGGEG